ncbi:baseplate J/gp47 family protein [uncultured Selenomonas sp.]|uniref:baseplate J/gp47 family protein n=1 Tax=uncultured Selenomonas sp. TaxID=159275 RepID=UPI0028EB932C|nr:baseplate J/gp47 family protein [uncultured Selenomonas sp.]
MYEKETQEAILARMLKNVPRDVDKREGSIIFDAAAPASIEFMLLYAELDYFLKNTFGDTAERTYLIQRARERGLKPKEATYAVVKGRFAPAALNIPLGTRYSCEAVNYAVTEKLTGGEYLLTCEMVGTAGNLPAGRLVPIDYVEGLQTAELVEVTVPGEAEEETEHFRARYLASFDSQAYGGNIADYRQKVNAIAGVGGVKVYPVWKGGGTVRITFMTSDFKPPAAELVQKVQTAIDPERNHGDGIGIAPIGHAVTVEGARNAAVPIGLHLSFASGTAYPTYQKQVEETIDAYFAELNKGWQDTQRAEIDNVSNTGLTIRISQIESRILAISGIEDIQHTTLNGREENLTLGLDELAIRGEVQNG